MPRFPQIPDGAARRHRKRRCFAMDNKHAALARPLRPCHDPRVDRFVAEAVANDDEGIGSLQSLMEAEVLIGVDAGWVRENLVERPGKNKRPPRQRITKVLAGRSSRMLRVAVDR